MNRGGINKKFGIDPQTIVSQIFPTPEQAKLQTSQISNGQIPRLDYLGFWTNLMSIAPGEPHPLLQTLCDQLTLRLQFQNRNKDEEKAKKDKKKSKDGKVKETSLEDYKSIFENPNSHVTVNSIVTTLSFFIFAPFKFDTKVLADWWLNFNESEYSLSAPECVKNLATFIKYRCYLDNIGWDDKEYKYLNPDLGVLHPSHHSLKNVMEREMGASNDVFQTLIGASVRIMSTAYVPLLSLDESDIVSSESCFIYTYLHDIISEHGRNYLLSVINSLIERARLVVQGPQQFIREQSFLAITHMIRTFFTKDAVNNVTLLRSALMELQHYYMWQQPYGKVAETLILLVQYELLSPGHTYRMHVQRENNVVDYKPNIGSEAQPGVETANASTTMANFFYNTKIDDKPFNVPNNGYKYNKPLFYLYENLDKHALSILTVIDPAEFRPENAVPVVSDANTLSADGNPITVDNYFDDNETPAEAISPKSIAPHYPPHGVMIAVILHAMSLDCNVKDDPDFSLPRLKYIPYPQLCKFYDTILTFNTSLVATYPSPNIANRKAEMSKLKMTLIDLAKDCQKAAMERGEGPLSAFIPDQTLHHNAYHNAPPNIDHVHVPIETPADKSISDQKDKNMDGKERMITPDHPGFPCNTTYDKLLHLFQQYLPKHVITHTAFELKKQKKIRDDAKSNESMRSDREDDCENEISQSQVPTAIRKGSVAHSTSRYETSTTYDSTTRNSEDRVVIFSAPLVKREIRLALVGSARFIHRVITAFQKIKVNHPQITDFLEISFLLLPSSSDNYLANYIARHDLWYFRHIYTPMLSPALILPWIRDDDVTTRLLPQSGSIGQSYLCQYLRSCIAQYAQYSHYTLPVTIYKVDCSTDQRATSITQTLYFIQRLELGIFPAIDEFRLMNPANANLRNDEIINHKDFKFNYLDMCIGYSKFDLMGHSDSEIVEDGVQFQSMVLSNIPSKQSTKSFNSSSYSTILPDEFNTETSGVPGDKKSDKIKDKKEKSKEPEKDRPGTEKRVSADMISTHSGGAQQNDVTSTPDPTNHGIELFITAPRVDKSRLRTNSLLSDPKQHLADIHCSSNNNFKVRLDGALYGPFKYIHVTAATSALGEVCKFPVKTFLPVTPGI